MTSRMTLKTPLAFLLILISLTSVGCHRSVAERDALMAQNIEAQNEIDRLRQTLDALRAQAASVPGLEARIAELEAEIARLRAQLAAKPAAPTNTGATGFEGIDNIDAERRGNLVTVRVASDILFSSGKVALKNSSKTTLNDVAGVLQSKYGSKTIRVEGYTDTDPIRKSGWKDNLELSLQRAAAVHRYLQTRGIDAGRMYAAGYGEEKPLGSKAASRRVEIVVVLSE